MVNVAVLESVGQLVGDFLAGDQFGAPQVAAQGKGDRFATVLLVFPAASLANPAVQAVNSGA